MGLEASAVSQVQLLLRLSREDLKQLLSSLQNTLSMELIDQQPVALTERTERLCASLLRRQNTIVGGGMQVRTLTHYLSLCCTRCDCLDTK